MNRSANLKHSIIGFFNLKSKIIKSKIDKGYFIITYILKQIKIRTNAKDEECEQCKEKIYFDCYRED